MRVRTASATERDSNSAITAISIAYVYLRPPLAAGTLSVTRAFTFPLVSDQGIVMNRSKTTSRRRFLKTGVAALASPYFVSSRVLGAGVVPPSDRIVMGAIGTGGQGMGMMEAHMNLAGVRFVAVCDVDTRHRDRAKAAVNAKNGNQDCQAYADFRKLVARKDIDAVTVTTPDHWHGLCSIAAAKSGKDIYCEKPLVNSIGEGRAVVDALNVKKRILQTGSHERSGSNSRFACELVRNGRIGKLHTIRVNLPCTDGHHKQARKLTGLPPTQPVPKGFDYDFWLGHTPLAPYSPRRCHFWWRFNLAYGGGEMTDRGAHVIDIAQLGGGFDETGPVKITAKGVRNEKSLYDTWWDYEFENEYANGVRMIGSSRGPRGVKFEGDKGWIFVHIHGGRLEANPASLLKEKIGENEIHLGRSPGHQRNFIECVKSRKQPVAAAEIGHRTASVCHLTNLAMMLERTLHWDPKAEKFANDDEANKLITPRMRSPWKL